MCAVTVSPYTIQTRAVSEREIIELRDVMLRVKVHERSERGGDKSTAFIGPRRFFDSGMHASPREGEARQALWYGRYAKYPPPACRRDHADGARVRAPHACYHDACYHDAGARHDANVQ